MKKFFILLFAVAAVLTLAACTGSDDFKETQDYKDLVDRNSDLVSKYDDLVKKYDDLLVKHNDLVGKDTDLQNQLTKAIADLNEAINSSSGGSLDPQVIEDLNQRIDELNALLNALGGSQVISDGQYEPGTYFGEYIVESELGTIIYKSVVSIDRNGRIAGIYNDRVVNFGVDNPDLPMIYTVTGAYDRRGQQVPFPEGTEVLWDDLDQDGTLTAGDIITFLTAPVSQVTANQPYTLTGDGLHQISAMDSLKNMQITGSRYSLNYYSFSENAFEQYKERVNQLIEFYNARIETIDKIDIAKLNSDIDGYNATINTVLETLDADLVTPIQNLRTAADNLNAYFTSGEALIEVSETLVSTTLETPAITSQTNPNYGKTSTIDVDLPTVTNLETFINAADSDKTSTSIDYKVLKESLKVLVNKYTAKYSKEYLHKVDSNGKTIDDPAWVPTYYTIADGATYLNPDYIENTVAPTINYSGNLSNRANLDTALAALADGDQKTELQAVLDSDTKYTAFKEFETAYNNVYPIKIDGNYGSNQTTSQLVRNYGPLYMILLREGSIIDLEKDKEILVKDKNLLAVAYTDKIDTIKTELSNIVDDFAVENAKMNALSDALLPDGKVLLLNESIGEYEPGVYFVALDQTYKPFNDLSNQYKVIVSENEVDGETVYTQDWKKVSEYTGLTIVIVDEFGNITSTANVYQPLTDITDLMIDYTISNVGKVQEFAIESETSPSLDFTATDLKELYGDLVTLNEDNVFIADAYTILFLNNTTNAYSAIDNFIKVGTDYLKLDANLNIIGKYTEDGKYYDWYIDTDAQDSYWQLDANHSFTFISSKITYITSTATDFIISGFASSFESMPLDFTADTNSWVLFEIFIKNLIAKSE